MNTTTARSEFLHSVKSNVARFLKRATFALPSLLWKIICALGRGVLAYIYFWINQAKESHSIVAGSLLALFLLIVAPALFVAIIAVTIDQVIYPKNTLPPQFADISHKSLSVEGKVTVLMDALVSQLEHELEKPTGWMSNDVMGFQLFDNHTNREQGVIYATKEIADKFFPGVSKLGLGDREHSSLVNARQNGFSYTPTRWGNYTLNNSERAYYEGIAWVRDYERALSEGKAKANVLTENIRAILAAIISTQSDNPGALGEPYGRVVSHDHVSWSKLDDDVYYPQGAAIVVRNFLTALLYCFYDDFKEKGSVENLEKAIEALDSVASFNPWLVTRGRHDSPVADHRIKLAGYYSEAYRRIEDVMKAIQN